MLKMLREAPKNKLVIYRDLEVIRTPPELAIRIRARRFETA